MNLCMDVLRILTVKALRGRTWCGTRVYDSPGEPADLRLPGERAPYVGVYCDDGDFTLGGKAGLGAGSLYDDGGMAWLHLEVNVAGQGEDAPEGEDLDPTDPDIDRAVADPGDLALTDAGLELRIGLIARQCLDALASPDNPWAELWRMLAPDRMEVQVRRGGSGMDADEEAFRFASRVLRIHVQLLAEPVPGDDQPADGFWAQCLAAMAADDQLRKVGAMIAAHLASTDQHQWQREQRRGTLTNAAVRGIGIGPVLADMAETPYVENGDGVTFHQEGGLATDV